MPKVIRPFPSQINRELLFSGEGEYRRHLAERGINEQKIGEEMKAEIQQAWVDVYGSEYHNYSDLSDELEHIARISYKGLGVWDAVTFTDRKLAIVKEANQILKNIFTDSLRDVLAKEREELTEEELAFIAQYQQAAENYDREEYEVDGKKLKYHTWKVLAEVYQAHEEGSETFTPTSRSLFFPVLAASPGLVLTTDDSETEAEPYIIADEVPSIAQNKGKGNQTTESTGTTFEQSAANYDLLSSFIFFEESPEIKKLVTVVRTDAHWFQNEKKCQEEVKILQTRPEPKIASMFKNHSIIFVDNPSANYDPDQKVRQKSRAILLEYLQNCQENYQPDWERIAFRSAIRFNYLRLNEGQEAKIMEVVDKLKEIPGSSMGEIRSLLSELKTLAPDEENEEEETKKQIKLILLTFQAELLKVGNYIADSDLNQQELTLALEFCNELLTTYQDFARKFPQAFADNNMGSGQQTMTNLKELVQKQIQKNKNPSPPKTAGIILIIIAIIG
ncbi:12038_t:CDS:2, partial [Racocetra persica]